MARRLTRGGVVTALLWGLLAAVLAIWVRSYLPDHLFLRPNRGRLIAIFASPYYAQFIDPPPGAPLAANLRWSTERAVDDARRWAGALPGRRDWTGAGFELIGGKLSSTRDGYFVLAVPCWFLALPVAAACCWRLATRSRRRLRELPGHCDGCGYDLRGNASGVCPECGTPVAPAAATAATR